MTASSAMESADVTGSPERWQLSRYLFALRDRVELPVTAILALPGESPDFVLEFATKTVGLEVTEATTTEFHDQLEYSERHGSYPGENDPDTQKLFVDPGWIGDSPETTNAALVMTSRPRRRPRAEPVKSFPRVSPFGLETLSRQERRLRK